MKKLGIVILIFLAFVVGIMIGGFNSSTDLMEDSKEKFEAEITEPDNTYQPVYSFDDTLVNKLARKVDDILEKLSDKFKR
jgi:flagellar basal body-associated protein FliL